MLNHKTLSTRCFSLFAGLAMLFAGMAAYGQDAPPQVTVTASDSSVTLAAAQSGLAAGTPLPLLLTLTPLPGWHTYWQNPGDAGAPLELSWDIPEGWQAAPLRWPLPERIATPPLVSFGYKGPVTFPLILTPPTTLAGESTRIGVTARYLVCADTCIPQHVALSLTLLHATVPTPVAATAWASAQSSLPQDTAPLTPQATHRNGETVRLTFSRAHLPAGQWQDAFFFPLPPGALVHSAPQHPRFTPDALTLTLTPQPDFKGTLTGMLRLTADDGTTVGLSVAAMLPAAAPSPAPALPASARPATLAPITALLLAFLGGLILNVMPCVFPVLSLKILALSRHSAREHRETLAESLAYAAGVIGSFVALAGILVTLKSVAGHLGWGFQLQEPWFVGALAILLFAVGLNLSGVYAIPQLWRGNQPHRHGMLQSALTGVLAVLLATPCTAPFMAPAIGFGLTQSPVMTVAIFATLGMGFALPFVVAGVFPRLLRFLPRPGGWMVTFRQVLAFPMYASALWLVWVIAQQSTPNGVGLVLLGGLAVAGTLTFISRLPRLVGIGLLSTTVFMVGGLLRAVPPAPPQAASVSTHSFSAAQLASLRTAGKPVLVNATAAWCITCKMNERLVLRHADVRALLAEHNVTVLTADWTQGDPAITAYLQSFDRAGVPLYVYYPPNKEPVVLPQILSVTLITELMNKN